MAERVRVRVRVRVSLKRLCFQIEQAQDVQHGLLDVVAKPLGVLKQSKLT